MNKEANEAIDNLGGTGATASLCGLTPSAVSQWRTNGIPKPWKMFLMHEHPEVFALPNGELDKNQ